MWAETVEILRILNPLCMQQQLPRLLFIFLILNKKNVNQFYNLTNFTNNDQVQAQRQIDAQLLLK